MLNTFLCLCNMIYQKVISVLQRCVLWCGIYLSTCKSIDLSHCLVWLFLSLSVSPVFLTICLSVYSFYVYIYLSVCLLIYLVIYLFCLPIHLFCLRNNNPICLSSHFPSIYLPTFYPFIRPSSTHFPPIHPPNFHLFIHPPICLHSSPIPTRN